METKKTSLWVAVNNPDIQRPGNFSWRTTICRDKKGWYSGTIYDDDVMEVCKVYFFGCSSPADFEKILKKKEMEEFAEKVQEKSLHLRPCEEMIDAIRDNGRIYPYTEFPLENVIYLDYYSHPE